MFIAFLLGLNDSVWNTQISALIGKAYPTTSNSTAAAFALYKFVQVRPPYGHNICIYILFNHGQAKCKRDIRGKFVLSE